MSLDCTCRQLFDLNVSAYEVTEVGENKKRRGTMRKYLSILVSIILIFHVSIISFSEKIRRHNFVAWSIVVQ